MEISSVAFNHESSIPSKHTCDGSDMSPALKIEGVPEESKSLVLIMDDPDVPKEIREDGMWDHWIVFNIPPDTKDIAEGEEPPGVHGLGTSNNTDYHGPCPPGEEHRYFFNLFALDAMLDLEEGVSKSVVEKAMKGHIVEKATLIGTYNRS